MHEADFMSTAASALDGLEIRHARRWPATADAIGQWTGALFLRGRDRHSGNSTDTFTQRT